MLTLYLMPSFSSLPFPYPVVLWPNVEFGCYRTQVVVAGIRHSPVSDSRLQTAQAHLSFSENSRQETPIVDLVRWQSAHVRWRQPSVAHAAARAVPYRLLRSASSPDLLSSPGPLANGIAATGPVAAPTSPALTGEG